MTSTAQFLQARDYLLTYRDDYERQRNAPTAATSRSGVRVRLFMLDSGLQKQEPERDFGISRTHVAMAESKYGDLI
jgi:hypothetical protein